MGKVNGNPPNPLLPKAPTLKLALGTGTGAASNPPANASGFQASHDPSTMTTEELLAEFRASQSARAAQGGAAPQGVASQPKPPQDAGAPGGTPQEPKPQDQETADAIREIRENLERSLGENTAAADEFARQAAAAKAEELQDIDSQDEDPLTAGASTGAERKFWGGVYGEDVTNNMRYGEERLKKNFLWYYSNPNLEAGIELEAQAYGQYSWDVPSLKNEFTDEQVPLMSPGGFGPFINPATGLPEYITGQVPGRTDTFSWNIVPGFEGYVGLNYPQQWAKNIPWIGGFVNAFTDGATIRATGRLIYWNTNKESGLLPYEISDVGAIQDPNTGDIEGFSKLKATSDTSGISTAIYVRYLTGDATVRLPGLAWGADQLGLTFDPDKEEGELAHLGKQLVKAVTSPTVAFLASVETRPKEAPDAAHETFMDAGQLEYTTMLIHKDVGVFVEKTHQKDTSKGYWGDVDLTRVGWSLPLLPVFHALGWDGVLADDYELHGDQFTPKAKTDQLLRESKFIVYAGSKKMRNPRQGTLLLPFESQADQSEVKGSAEIYGAALEVRLGEKPFGNWLDILEKWKITVGVQFEDVDVEGQGDLTVFIPSIGGVGGINTESSAELLPDPSGLWQTWQFDANRRFKLATNLYLNVGIYGDRRWLLGDVTDNSVSDDPITSLGAYVGVKTGDIDDRSSTDR